MRKMGHAQEFLTVGAMGHASCIALTIALNKPERQVSKDTFYSSH